MILLGLEIEVVVTDDVEPGNTDQGNRAVQAAEEIEIVEHNVTEGDPKLGVRAD